MEGFVQNIYELDELDEPKTEIPLLYVKYVIDVLAPLIVFSLKNDNLLIHTLNGTELTPSMYSYYMQIKTYPLFQKYLKKRETICRVFHNVSFVGDDTVSYEDLKKPLEEYYNITKDPRKLLSIKSVSNSITYTKESWFIYLRGLQPECYDEFKKVKRMFKLLSNIFMENDKFFNKIVTYIQGESKF